MPEETHLQGHCLLQCNATLRPAPAHRGACGVCANASLSSGNGTPYAEPPTNTPRSPANGTKRPAWRGGGVMVNARIECGYVCSKCPLKVLRNRDTARTIRSHRIHESSPSAVISQFAYASDGRVRLEGISRSAMLRRKAGDPSATPRPAAQQQARIERQEPRSTSEIGANAETPSLLRRDSVINDRRKPPICILGQHRREHVGHRHTHTNQNTEPKPPPAPCPPDTAQAEGTEMASSRPPPIHAAEPPRSGLLEMQL